jgi:DNA modification methylase
LRDPAGEPGFLLGKFLKVARLKMLEVEDQPIDGVIPYARNARKISDQAISKVAASIQEFGFRQPIVVDEQNVVVAGHTRLAAAQKLGLGKVPVHVATGLTAQQIKAYRLMDNRSHQESEWDYDLLPDEFNELLAEDYDIGLTGFDDSEIERLLALDDVPEGETDPDDVPDLPSDPVSKPGDVWICGKHRIMCGDSTSADEVAKLLAGVEPHLMVTDPPYGVNYEPAWRDRAKALNKGGIGGGSRSTGQVMNDDRADWSEAWALFPGDVIYVWHAGNKAHIVAASLESNDFEIRCQIIWAKQNFAISRGHYHPHHEPCWYAVRKSKNGHWAGDRKQSTLWEISNRSAFGGGNKEDADTNHGTQKPVECMKRPIENNSNPGQAVYEPFIGSGTTLIAATMTGRICYGMEIAPEYVDLAVTRWQNFTGEKATLESDGREFEQAA